MPPTPIPPAARRVAIIGGGPAGLMAAEIVAAAGMSVEVFEAMPSVGRKFLMAGKGGMNITHAEPIATFYTRYTDRQIALTAALDAFPPQALRAWIHNLGIDTFVGSSGRVFPTEMKAAPLLRAWLHRLRAQGVQFHVRHRWQGWDHTGALCFSAPTGPHLYQADAVILALGGGSWPQLGSDAGWIAPLSAQHIPIAPLQAANCGFNVAWSAHFRERFAGAYLKASQLIFTDYTGKTHQQIGEWVISQHGVEGSLIYALSKPIRETLSRCGTATLYVDLTPNYSVAQLISALSRGRGRESLSNHLRKTLRLEGVHTGLIFETLHQASQAEVKVLAEHIKYLPLQLQSPRPIAEAISSAGGVMFEGLDAQLMLNARPGVFCAGEMLDWEAPTGGYLLTATFATGRLAGNGAINWLNTPPGA